MKPIWVDGVRFSSLVNVYMELGVCKQPSKNKVKKVLETGGIYNGHIVCLDDPSKMRPEKLERAKGDLLLPRLCTHHLGFNPDDRE